MRSLFVIGLFLILGSVSSAKEEQKNQRKPAENGFSGSVEVNRYAPPWSFNIPLLQIIDRTNGVVCYGSTNYEVLSCVRINN